MKESWTKPPSQRCLNAVWSRVPCKALTRQRTPGGGGTKCAATSESWHSFIHSFKNTNWCRPSFVMTPKPRPQPAGRSSTSALVGGILKTYLMCSFTSSMGEYRYANTLIYIKTAVSVPVNEAQLTPWSLQVMQDANQMFPGREPLESHHSQAPLNNKSSSCRSKLPSLFQAASRG